MGLVSVGGDHQGGGDCGHIDFLGVTDVYANHYAAVALDKITGNGQCWGDARYGGNCTHIDFWDVTDVYSTGRAFMAQDRSSGKAQC